MSLAGAKGWDKRFREGRESLADDARSGTQCRITNDIVQLVDELVTQDRRVAVKAIAGEVGLSVGSVHTIMIELAQSVHPMDATLFSTTTGSMSNGPLYLSSAALCLGRE